MLARVSPKVIIFMNCESHHRAVPVFSGEKANVLGNNTWDSLILTYESGFLEARKLLHGSDCMSDSCPGL